VHPEIDKVRGDQVMGYVAVKGGTEAIENASRLLLYERLKGTSRLLEAGQIREHKSADVAGPLSPE
jgi:hypothetical protein